MGRIIQLSVVNDQGSIRGQVEPVVGRGQPTSVLVPSIGWWRISRGQTIEDNLVTPDYTCLHRTVGDLGFPFPV